MIYHPYMDVPIPYLSYLRARKADYRSVPIRATTEECVVVNDIFLCESYYWHYKPVRPEGATEEIFLRTSVVEKLLRIERQLLPLGLRLIIQEGYRPISVQEFVYNHSVPKNLKKGNPNLSDEEISRLVSQFAASANGDVQTSPPPHLTGGAVDLNLVYIDSHEQVDMAKKLGSFNTLYPDALESMDAEGIEEARRFRRLLYWVLFYENMVTNPTEWWHASYGDQLWASVKCRHHAHFGPARFD